MDQWSYEQENEDSFSDVEMMGESIVDVPPPEELPSGNPFKCIGATRDKQQQLVLKSVCHLPDKKVVPVKLQPEPNNPFDAKAIAFVTFVDDKWQRVGYVVRECLEDVHHAMRNGDIMKVEFAWVKYLLSFPRSGPGYYAAVNITSRGEWSRSVVASGSRVVK